MAELFRFRCSECGKLLGVSPKKVGRPVACPKCGAELIVPEIEPDAPPTEDDPSGSFAGLGIDLGFTSPLGLRPPLDRPVVPDEPRGGEVVEAIAFLDQVAATSPSVDFGDAAATGPAAFLAPAPEATDATAEGDADEPEPIVQTPVEPLVSRSRQSRIVAATPVDRRRDVVLPRTAVVAWALFAILALGMSFVAGLMIGHYRWK